MKITPFLLDHLISSNLYFGFNSTFRHVSMMFYVSHVVNKIDIINLVKTLYNLRLFFSFLRKVYFNRGFV